MRALSTLALVAATAALCAGFGVRGAAALDAMGDALEQDAANENAPRRTTVRDGADADARAWDADAPPLPHSTEAARVDTLRGSDPKHVADAAATNRDRGAALAADTGGKAPSKKSVAPLKRGEELSGEQLAALGVTTSTDAKAPEQTLERAQAAVANDKAAAAPAAAAAAGAAAAKPAAAAASEKPVAADARAAQDPAAVATAPPAPANVSIDHVEAHLQILQQLELSVAQSIEEMDARRPSRRSSEAQRISKELAVLKSNLRTLAESLNGTLSELVVVEKDSEQKSKQLAEVLEQQQADAQEQLLEAHGMKAVDYETGHLRNTSGLAPMRLDKLEAAEKKADPAVLHYDLELLAQVAMLLGAAAIGGILAAYVSAPPHAGYLLGGALVGPSCLALVRQAQEVETLSLLGSIFLLFGHGAGYAPMQLDAHLRRYLAGGMAYIAAVVALVALVAASIGWSSSFGEGLIVGVAVCFTTTAPLYEYIRANQIHESSYGRTLTAIIAVQDVLMSFALGTPEWFSSRHAGWIGVAALRSVVAYGVVALLAHALHAHAVPRLLRFLVAMEQVHHAPLVLLGVVSVCLFMALLSEAVGLSLECGAFLAGLAFAGTAGDAKAAFTSIRVMENLFGSMFFACVGLIVNPVFLLKNAPEVLAMVLLIVAVKTGAMTAVMTFFDVKMHKALLAAAGLCHIGELALIFMIKAHAARLVSRRLYLLFVAAIAVFLGGSSVLHRQVLLARRKSVFRLPSILRRAPLDDDAGADDDDDGDTREEIGGDSRGGGDGGASAAATMSSSTPRRKSTKVVVT